MRNFSKTLISMAAVMAVGSAMAAGAMAADLTIGKDTVKTDGKISISGVTADKSQYTLLVVQGTTAEGATEVTYDATEATIKQIDQNDTGVAFTEAVVGTDLADGDYKVMVGNNDGTVDTGYFTLSSAPVVETKDILVGDTDLNGKIIASDTMWMRRYSANYTTNIGQIGTEYDKADGTGKYIVGDTDLNGKIIASDTMWMRRYSANYTTNIGQIGSTITVIAE